MNELAAELPWLWAGLTGYLVATIVALWGVVPRHAGGALVDKPRSHEYVVLASLLAGVALLAVAIGVRWMRQGHGPWINLFELLMSQLWSLGLIFSVLYWRLPALRPSAVVVLPAMWILGSWVLLLEPIDSHFPATYYNYWKWIHVGIGKAFLGFLLAGVGLAGVMLLRCTQRGQAWFRRMPADADVDRLAWRFMMLALVFDSLMLIAGAVWAQDAWGRYWSWDPLETSAFLTWVALAIGLHVRLTYRVPYWVSGLMIIGIFMLAFSTYFGTPYLSPSAHKGMI